MDRWICDRLRHSTNLSNEATVTSITTLQTLLNDAQGKLDRLLISAPLAYLDSTSPSRHFDSTPLQPEDLSNELLAVDGPGDVSDAEGLETTIYSEEGVVVDTIGHRWTLLGRTSLTKEREREILIGAGGAVVGLSLSLLYGMLGSSR